jgi:hypothetical protein
VGKTRLDHVSAGGATSAPCIRTGSTKADENILPSAPKRRCAFGTVGHDRGPGSGRSGRPGPATSGPSLLRLISCESGRAGSSSVRTPSIESQS